MSDVSVEEGWIVTLDVLKYLKGKVTFECLDSWIVTLDVLKYGTLEDIDCYIELNSNIRCIEMYVFAGIIFVQGKLNSNIRCIEIWILLQYRSLSFGWIVTLDVLK